MVFIIMVGYSRTNCFLCGKSSEGLPHFRFPADVVFRSAWANACNFDPAAVTKSHKLCCRHFKSDDYSDFFYNNVETSRTRLKKDSIPTLELPDEENSYEQNEVDIDSRQQNRADKNSDNIDLVQGNHVLPGQISNGDKAQFPGPPSELNVDDANDGQDEDDDMIDIDYDKYGKDIPDEFNNLVAITRFMKKKNKRLNSAHLQNRRLKRRFEKIKQEYIDFGTDKGIELPDLSDLELDV